MGVTLLLCVESTPFRVHWFQGDTISLQNRKRIVIYSSKNSVDFYSFLVVSSWWVFLTERFFLFLYFFPDFQPSLGLFVFIFIAFFPGWYSWDCVGFSGVHFVMAVWAAQKLVWSSFHSKIFAFIFRVRHFKTSIFQGWCCLSDCGRIFAEINMEDYSSLFWTVFRTGRPFSGNLFLKGFLFSSCVLPPPVTWCAVVDIDS